MTISSGTPMPMQIANAHVHTHMHSHSPYTHLCVCTYACALDCNATYFAVFVFFFGAVVYTVVVPLSPIGDTQCRSPFTLPVTLLCTQRCRGACLISIVERMSLYVSMPTTRYKDVVIVTVLVSLFLFYPNIVKILMGISVDMVMDMCVDMCVHMCADVCVDMCIDVCIDMCVDMCADMYVGKCADMCVCVCVAGIAIVS